jgi:hypothetical protein
MNVRGSHSGTVEDSSLLVFYAVLTGIYRRSFETSVNTSRQGATIHKTRVSKYCPAHNIYIGLHEISFIEILIYRYVFIPKISISSLGQAMGENFVVFFRLSRQMPG